VNERVKRFLPVLVIVFLGVACYANALRNGFVWDDKTEVLGNRFLRSWAFLPRLFTTDLRPANDAGGEPTPVYRPLRAVLHLIDYQIWGPNPFGFHLTNVVLHIVNGLLVYGLLRVLRIEWTLALLFVALFVCHPLQTEAVTYIASRGTELCTLFMLVSVLALLKSFAAESEQRSHWLLAGSAVAFGCALLSKEMALALPVTLAAAGWLAGTQRPIPKKRCAVAVVLFAVVLAAYAAARFAVLSVESHPALGSLGLRVVLAMQALAVDLGLFVAPVNLHMERTLPTIGWQVAALAAVGALTVVVLVTVGTWFRARDRRVVFGLILFGGSFLATSGLIPLNAQIAEAWLYWPMIGLLVALAAGLEDAIASRRWLGRMVFVTGCCVICVFCLLTIRQNRVWRDDITLYKTLIARGGGTRRIRENLALDDLDAGDLNRAREQLRVALKRDPRSATAMRAMGLLLRAEGDGTGAENWFQRGVEAHPTDTRLRVALALQQEQNGELDAAEKTLREAAAQRPSLLASLELARFYYRRQRWNEAERVIEEVLAVDPMHAEARNTLGMILFRKGDLDGAEEQFHLALRYDRWMADAHANLAAVADARGDLTGALREYDDAMRLAPRNADFLYGLATLLARHGHTDDARQTLQRALEIDPGFDAAKKLLDQLSQSGPPGTLKPPPN
jgi:Tfp pilus assembly protein PilF